MALADELARGLPGLPVELKDGRVDAKGFHRPAKGKLPAVEVPWANVTDVLLFDWGSSLGVRGRRPGRDAIGPVFGAQMKRDQARVIERAWREYVLRTIERDCVLRGSVYLLNARIGYLQAAMISLVLAAMGGYFAYMAWRSGWVADTPGAVMVLSLLELLIALGVLLSAAVALHLRRAAGKLKERWPRWELRKDGLFFWPEGVERELAPSVGDIVTPQVAEIDRERVPFEHMSHQGVLVRLLLAAGERAGATCRAVNWLRPSKLFVPAFCVASFSAVAFVYARLGMRDAAARTPYVLVALLIGASILAAVLYLYQRARLRDTLADGRAMLERLGW